MDLLTNSQRIEWIELWKSFLEAPHSDFFTIYEVRVWKDEQNLIRSSPVDFTGDFFNNGKYKWSSSVYNAEMVINNAIFYPDSYTLFYNNFFIDEFNLHKSVSSLCDQNQDITEEEISEFDIVTSPFYKTNLSSKDYYNTLAISEWPYKCVIISAICFLLENIYTKYSIKIKNLENKTTNEKKFKILTKSISVEVEFLFHKIGAYFLQENYSLDLFTVLKNTHIFRIQNVASVKTFIFILTNLKKKKYPYFVNHVNKNINKNILRSFFKIFQIEFIFSDSFLETEINEILLNTKNGYYVENVINMLTIYKLFFSVCDKFEKVDSMPLKKNHPFSSFSKKFCKTDLKITSQSNWKLKELENIFPSIRVNPNVELNSKNYSHYSKKIVSLFYFTVVALISSFLFPKIAHSMYRRSVLNSQPISSASVSATDKPRISANTTTPKTSEISHKKKEIITQSSEQHLIYPVTKLLPEFTVSTPEPILLVQHAKTKEVFLMGNSGPYKMVQSNDKVVIKALSRAGFTVREKYCVKAHFFSKNFRDACQVSRQTGWAITVPEVFNKLEESSKNASSRKFSYTPERYGISLKDVIREHAHNSWEFVYTQAQLTTDSHGILNVEILDFLNNRWEENLDPAVNQSLHYIKMITQNKEHTTQGWLCLYTNHTIQKIGAHSQELGHYNEKIEQSDCKLVKPGTTVSETIEKITQLYELGLEYIQHIDPSDGRQILTDNLKNVTSEAFTKIKEVSLKSFSLAEQGDKHIPQFSLAFKNLENLEKFNNPCPSSSEVMTIIDKIKESVLTLKITNLSAESLDRVLERGSDFGIGDFTTQSKSEIFQITRHEESEIFKKSEINENDAHKHDACGGLGNWANDLVINDDLIDPADFI